MENNKVKVIKDGIVKTINKEDLPTYIAMGWKEIPTYGESNPSFEKFK